MPDTIPFHSVHLTGNEHTYLADALSRKRLSGDGHYTKLCHAFIEETFSIKKALLTHSCTGALEMAAILADIQPGDEVIMPSFTFVSSALAFVLRGGVPVFIDIRPDTLNMDETLIEQAITDRTKAIVPVHYAGVACEMDTIMNIARRHNLVVIEDAAQGIYATYKGKPLGSIGDLGCYSFHDTKNIISGEGGALLINKPELVERAEIIREKGTDRSKFLSGSIDKYTWQDLGSSYLPPETTAAFLLAQLQAGQTITDDRLTAWQRYDQGFAPGNMFQRPAVPDDCQHNAHIYFGLLDETIDRQAFMQKLKDQGIQTTTHYVPLHSSPAGKKFGRVAGTMNHTDNCAARLVRFPMYCGIGDHVERVTNTVNSLLGHADVVGRGNK